MGRKKLRMNGRGEFHRMPEADGNFHETRGSNLTPPRKRKKQRKWLAKLRKQRKAGEVGLVVDDSDDGWPTAIALFLAFITIAIGIMASLK